MHDITEQQARRACIERLEDRMWQLPQADIPTAHNFAPGMYIRTITIPAGATLTGRVHKTEHIFIVSKGEIMLATEDGVKHVKAPFQIVCRPGLKRAGHALTECVVSNVHITSETDMSKLEADLVEPLVALPGSTEPQQLEN